MPDDANSRHSRRCYRRSRGAGHGPRPTSCCGFADIDRAITFYETVLGLHVERRLETIGLVQLRAGSSMIDLVPRIEDETTAATWIIRGADSGDGRPALTAHLKRGTASMPASPAALWRGRLWSSSMRGTKSIIDDPARSCTSPIGFEATLDMEAQHRFVERDRPVDIGDPQHDVRRGP